jgi:NAD(P)-dependent dehydrogenase (short-subunit alcohol dehydrogenase family)
MAARHEGRVAIVTGGASGIGKGCVERYVADGASVVIADIATENANALADSLGDKVRAITCDVTDEAQVTAMVDETVGHFGRLDFMVNNAGFVIWRSLLDTSAETWRNMMDVNITGIFLSMKAGAKAMIDQGEGGVIINASSGGGRHGVANVGHYCATKAAIIMMSQAAAGEWASHKIRVNCYTPGHIETPMMEGLLKDIGDAQSMTRDEAYKMLEDTVPWGRWGKPEDVAATVSWLCTNDAEYISGQCIAMNGAELPW